MLADPSPEIRTIASEIAYRNPWTTMTHDVVERSDGRRGVYGVLHKPDFVVVVPVERGGFHVVEQYRYPVRHRGREFPMGAYPTSADGTGHDVRHSELEALELAAHELREETGLTAARLVHLARLQAGAGVSTAHFHVVVATGLTPGEQSLEDEEFGLEASFMTHDELWAAIDDGSVRDGFTVTALLLFERAARRDPSLWGEGPAA